MFDFKAILNLYIKNGSDLFPKTDLDSDQIPRIRNPGF